MTAYWACPVRLAVHHTPVATRARDAATADTLTQRITLPRIALTGAISFLLIPSSTALQLASRSSSLTGRERNPNGSRLFSISLFVTSSMKAFLSFKTPGRSFYTLFLKKYFDRLPARAGIQPARAGIQRARTLSPAPPVQRDQRIKHGQQIGRSQFLEGLLSEI